MVNDIELKKLWSALSPKYNIGLNYDDFKSKMITTAQRLSFYNAMSKFFNIGDYKSFEQRLSSNPAPPLEHPQDNTIPQDFSPLSNNGEIPSQKPQNKLTPINLTSQDVLNGKFVEYGMVGNIVGQIQQLLIKNGYKNISKTGQPDNKFGARTKAAVIQFQHDKGIGADGVVGPMTWDKLNGLPTNSGLKLSNLVPQDNTDNNLQTSYSSPNYTGGELGTPINK